MGLSASLIRFTLLGIVIDEETLVTCHSLFQQEMSSFYVQIHEVFVRRTNVRSKADAHNRRTLHDKRRPLNPRRNHQIYDRA